MNTAAIISWEITNDQEKIDRARELIRLPAKPWEIKPLGRYFHCGMLVWTPVGGPPWWAVGVEADPPWTNLVCVRIEKTIESEDVYVVIARFRYCCCRPVRVDPEAETEQERRLRWRR